MIGSLNLITVLALYDSMSKIRGLYFLAEARYFTNTLELPLINTAMNLDVTRLEISRQTFQFLIINNSILALEFVSSFNPI